MGDVVSNTRLFPTFDASHGPGMSCVCSVAHPLVSAPRNSPAGQNRRRRSRKDLPDALGVCLLHRRKRPWCNLGRLIRQRRHQLSHSADHPTKSASDWARSPRPLRSPCCAPENAPKNLPTETLARVGCRRQLKLTFMQVPTHLVSGEQLSMPHVCRSTLLVVHFAACLGTQPRRWCLNVLKY